MSSLHPDQRSASLLPKEAWASFATPLQRVLREQAAVLADAQLLDSRERAAFASLAEAMLVRGFASELAVLEAERWASEAT